MQKFKFDSGYKTSDLKYFEKITGINISGFFPRLSILIFILLGFIIAMMFVPWIQTSQGNGSITALNPEDRVQQIVSPVAGRVNSWFVRDGSKVKKGDKIVEIVDVDPYLLSRLNMEATTMQERLNASIDATRLAYSNYNRQKSLFNDGLASKKDFEFAEINYKKNLADQQYYKAQLIKVQSSLAKQKSQLIVADRNGYVVNTLSSAETKIVKPGEVLATFLPDTNNIAVEIFISGNDVPLIFPGRKVRLVFDGWPSIQFSGWPSVSVGIFGGIVKVLDYVASPDGTFRALIVPDPKDKPWPSKNFLRIGAKAQGYIQLNKVLLGYELWRQLNGFPIAVNNKNNKAILNYYDEEKGGDK